MVLALEIPLICVVSKVDLVPSTVLEASKKQLFRILKSSAANKLPIQMRNEKVCHKPSCTATHKLDGTRGQ